MNNALASLAGLVLFLVPLSYSQNAESLKSSDEQSLRTAIKAGNISAIYKAGSSGDRSLVPDLKSQLHNKKRVDTFEPPESPSSAAHYALAKLGETSDLKWLHCENHSKRKQNIIYPRLNLKYVGGWFAIEELVYLLDDERFYRALQADKTNADIGPVPISCHALVELSDILPEGPVKITNYRDEFQSNRANHIRMWKEWIESHKEELQKLQPNWQPADNEGCP